MLVAHVENVGGNPGRLQNHLLRLLKPPKAVQRVGVHHVDIDAVSVGADFIGNSGGPFAAVPCLRIAPALDIA